MHKLQETLVSPPILALPNTKRKHTLETDACSVQIWCLLSHEQPEATTEPGTYWLKPVSLTKVEQAYDTTQHKFLAVSWSELMLLPYLEGARLRIRTDQELWKRILIFADGTGHLGRWRLCLSKLWFHSAHCAGIKHQAAAALSHLIATGEDQAPVNDDLPVEGLWNHIWE